MRFAVAVAVIGLVLGGATPIAAQQGGSSGHQGHSGMKDMKGHDMHGMEGMSGMGGKPTSPGSSSAWTALESVRDSIGGLIEAGKLADVHGEAEKLAPLSRALLDGARALPEAKRARVESALRQLPAIGTALDKAGDAGDVAATRRELGRLRGAITLIEAQDPDGVLHKVVAPSDIPAGRVPTSKPSASHHHGPMGHSARPIAAVDETPKATLRVKASDFKFAPAAFAMKAGEATLIQFENDGAAEHDFVVKTPDGKADWIHLHADVNEAVAATFRIDERGKYRVICSVPGHKEVGMVGELVVQ